MRKWPDKNLLRTLCTKVSEIAWHTRHFGPMFSEDYSRIFPNAEGRAFERTKKLLITLKVPHKIVEQKVRSGTIRIGIEIRMTPDEISEFFGENDED